MTSATERKKRAEDFYSSFIRYTDLLFGYVTRGTRLEFDSIAKKIKTVCEFVQKDRHYLMHAKQMVIPGRNENYHAAHSVRSCIIAIVIGTYLKMPKHRLIELGVAALLRDIGILKLSPKVYMENYVMTIHERRMLYVHPVDAYKILKLYNFPITVCVAVLEHHERVNGTGYPQKLTCDRTSLYAKIINVACSYEVYSTKTVNGVKCGHKAIMRLLKNEGKKYDDTVIRALVYSLSLYPVGLFVLLSNGKQGQVIDADPKDPRYPFVRIREPDGKHRTVQISARLSVVRPLTRAEVGPH